MDSKVCTKLLCSDTDFFGFQEFLFYEIQVIVVYDRREEKVGQEESITCQPIPYRVLVMVGVGVPHEGIIGNDHGEQLAIHWSIK